ncbi:hypothetical protein HF638_12575 [Paenibacillus sp. SZ31]|uniref:hypothetical protein n=1 Tax=Paenibacillus sp. SZ31 TaxID=2725555 RepID=UPI00146AC5A5|nr:hypothetical protein [Paenibacillus sp. SZ31]NMI04818.1 hypothetical protein [Paenibacillus sp. SZ31]
MDCAWIAVFGTLGGSALATLGTVVSTKLKERSDNKIRIWNLEDIEMKRLQDKKEEEFRVYNEVLKADGEHTITAINDHGLGELNGENYKQHVRPILYRNLHILPSSLRKKTRKLDSLLVTEEFYNYNTLQEWQDEQYGAYQNIISTIESRYSESTNTKSE